MISAFAPGRVCFFGEHQDYHDMPVIAAAIDLGITFMLQRYIDAPRAIITMPDIGTRRVIDLEYPVKYDGVRDYLASTLNVLHGEGIEPSKGFECQVRGTLPISAGASSSSAMVVSWVTFLSGLFGEGRRALDAGAVARLANQAEVGEFGEAGGFMDHVASAAGGVLLINPDFTVERFNVPRGLHMVLGNSMQRKETVENLRAMRAKVDQEVTELDRILGGFAINDPKFCNQGFIDENKTAGLGIKKNYPLVYANLQNGVITMRAAGLLKGDVDGDTVARVGSLLDRHHHYLRDYLGISTGRIERLVSAAKEAGALGCKINGSGFGGCMFAVCSNIATQQQVHDAINDAGGEATNIKVARGARFDTGS